MSVTLADVRSELNQIVDPNTGASLGAGIKDAQIQVKDGQVSVQIVLGYPAASQLQAIGDLVRARLAAIGAAAAVVEVSSRVIAHAVQPGVQLVAGRHCGTRCAPKGAPLRQPQ